MNTVTTSGREAWRLSTAEIELDLTVRGGHMAPVRFFANSDSPVEPYYISPWQEETADVPGPGVLSSLRGDFFCMPFGGNNVLDGENHPPHGEVSEAEWTPVRTDVGSDESVIEAELETKIRPGKVTKCIALKSGHSALYISHRIEGFSGPVSLGHHAIMRGDRTHYLSCPPLITGITDTSPPPPSSGEYASMPAGIFFDRLDEVPTIWKEPGVTDCTVFPAREGFVDIIQVYPQVPSSGEPLWFTAAVPSHGYLWYSFKDAAVLPSTVLWQENRGRHGAPWNGRNSCIGIEEVLAHLASGLTVSASENALTARGLRTSRNIDGREPLEVRSLQGVCRIPQGFDRVADVTFGNGSVRFISEAGPTAETTVDWNFVLS